MDSKHDGNRRDKRASGEGWLALMRPFLLFATALLILFPAAIAVDPVAGSLYAQWWRPLWLTAEFTTHFGEAHWTIGPTALIVLLAWLRHLVKAGTTRWHPTRAVRICVFFLAASAGALLAATILKIVFGRARPHLMDVVGPFSWHPVSFDAANLSFPSGHASSIGAVGMAVALLWPRLRGVAFCVALWLAITRVFVGAHYPSDVVAGLLLGGCVALGLSRLASRRQWLDFPKGDACAPPLVAPTKS